MTPKAYLSQIQTLNIKIKQRQKEKDELKEYYGISGIDYSREKLKASRSKDAPFVKTIEKIIHLEEEISLMIDEHISLKNKMIGEIQELSNPIYVEILYKRYVEVKSLQAISKEMNYAYQYIRAVHGRALQEFERVHPTYF